MAGSPGFAQATKTKGQEPVYTDPDQVDDDYAVQGEYRGWQRETAYPEIRQAGLQVVALGNGEFSAVGYMGGLPGEGWFGGERHLFTGKRQGDLVELTGSGVRLVVEAGGASLFDDADEKIGEFRRVARVSPTMGARAPAGAIELFGEAGTTEQLVSAKVTPDGLLMAGTETIQPFSDFRLHAEFRLPYKPLARGQARGNSGFYLQSRYEVQVLDSFGLEGVENECGALYKTRRPDFNMCFPPLVWQTYDIDLTSPRFDVDGKKLSNMRISVWHNGVMIHNNVEIPNKTGAGRPEAPQPLPTKLQDHQNPVVYRNVWLVEKSVPSDHRKLAAVRQR
jgi:hypothetical protein